MDPQMCIIFSYFYSSVSFIVQHKWCTLANAKCPFQVKQKLQKTYQVTNKLIFKMKYFKVILLKFYSKFITFVFFIYYNLSLDCSNIFFSYTISYKMEHKFTLFWEIKFPRAVYVHDVTQVDDVVHHACVVMLNETYIVCIVRCWTGSPCSKSIIIQSIIA